MTGFSQSMIARIVGLATILLCMCYAQADEQQEKYKVEDTTFKCIQKMTAVRHFFVDNLGGNIDATVSVAKSGKGDYPEGTVLQLIPNEVMIKQQKGFNAETHDWEFFYIDIDKDGSKIFSRGFKNVNNRLGLNCFDCHNLARTEFDLVCEQDHGCAELPLTRAMFKALQDTDPRCAPLPPLSTEDAQAPQALGPAVEQLEKTATVKKQ